MPHRDASRLLGPDRGRGITGDAVQRGARPMGRGGKRQSPLTTLERSFQTDLQFSGGAL